MFKKFIKATCLLAGVMFVAACTDYAEDIRDINGRIEQLEGKTMSSLTEQKEGLEAALKTLEGELGNQIADNIAQLQGQINDLNSDLEKLEAKQEKDIQDLNAAIAKKADQSALEALDDKLDDEIEKLQKQITKNAEDISTLTRDIGALTSRMNSAEDALNTLNNTTIPDIKNQIADLQKAIDAKVDKEDLEAYKTETKKTLDNMQAAINELYDGLSTLDEKILEYYKKVKEELEEELKKGLEGVNGRVDEVEKRLAEVNGKIEELNGKIEKLDTKVEDYYKELTEKFNNYVLQSVFDEFKKNMEFELEDLKAGLEDQKTALENAKTDLNNKILSTKDELKKLIAAINDKLAGDIKELENALIEAVKLIKKNEKAIADLQTGLADAIDQIDAITEDGGVIDKKVKAAIDKVTEEFDEKIEDIQSDINDLQTKLNALQIDVEDLLARMQSIVYVPDYNDGKITIDYAKIGEGIVEGQQTIRYKVTPANCAEPLATLAKAQTAEKPVLSYLIEEVTIRTRAEELVPTFTVVDAKADDNGFLTLKVDTRNLGDEFYAGTKSYSVALLVTDGNNDRTTEYANCVPGTAKEIVPEILDKDDEIITDKEDAAHYEIEYVDTGIENGEVVLPDHYVAFHFENETKYYTKEQLYDKFGYDVVVEGPELSYDYTPDNTYADVFENDETSTYVKTFLTKIEAKAIGNIENVKYTYTAAGKEIFAAANVEITKETAAQIVFGTEEEPVVIYWNFLLDAWSDYGRDITLREELPLAFVEGQVFPEGADWADICSSVGVVGTPEMKSNSKVITDESGIYWWYLDVDGTPAITIQNFAWDKTYTLENKVEYPTYIIKVKAYIKTVDRYRGEIKVIYDDFDKTYTRDMEIAEGEISDELEAVYNKILEVNADTNPYVLYDYEAEADMDVEDFLNTVFAHEGETAYEVNAKTLMVGTHVTDLRYKTRMVIAEDSQTVSYRYTYKSHYFENPLKYQKDVIFWFFDKEKEFVHLEKTINFEMPTYNYLVVPSRAYTIKSDKGEALCAHALGRYMDADGEVISIDSKQVHSFDVENLDLLQVFYVTLEDKDGFVEKDFVTIDEIKEEGLVSEFRFVSKPKDENIVFVDDEENPEFIHIINYGGRDEYVYLVGDLYLVDSDFENGGNKVKLTTRFDTIDAYKNFAVKKYNPIGEFLGGKAEIEVIDVKNYNIEVLKLFHLSDYRNDRTTYELIDAETEEGWVVGDGENGYALDRDVRDVYDLKVNYSLVKQELPTELRLAHGRFDEKTGVLTFVNDGNLSLFDDIVVPVRLTLEHKWCNWDWEENVSKDSAIVELTFKKNAVRPEEQ